MISVVIPTLNAASTLLRTLSPLVSGVADGLIREAIVADGGSDDETIEMAEAAGCTIVRAGKTRALCLIAGANAARSEWLLFLFPGARLAPCWLLEARRFLSRGGSAARAGVFRLAFDEDLEASSWRLLWARLCATLNRLPQGQQGLLIARTLYNEAGGYDARATREDLDLCRRLGPKRLVGLNCEAAITIESWRAERSLSARAFLGEVQTGREAGISSKD